MSNTISINKKKQIQVLKRALFGKSVGKRMQALLILAQAENSDGGWLLETVLKFEKLSVKR